jgi:serine/threonine protein kinase
MQNCADIPGVLPLLDNDLRKKSPFWLVSALAVPLDKKISGEPSVKNSIEICRSIAKTLSEMHSRDYSHRDIKPENIFYYNQSWCLGDFGLANFPGKNSITETGERLGPANYIAPEMLNNAKDSDGRSADVYSLGKLMWRLVAGQRYPLPGSHERSIPAMTLSANVIGIDLSELDALLEGMTRLDPKARPTMREVVGSLEAWLAPAPTPRGPVDLAPFAKRIADLTADRRREQEHFAVVRRKVDAELNRIRDRLWPDIAAIGAEFKDKIGNVSSQGSWLEGQQGLPFAAPPLNGDNPILFRRLEISTRIHTGTAVVDLSTGFNLVTQMIAGLENVALPAWVAAGYRIRGPLTAGILVSEDIIWGDFGNFRFGYPEERVVISRLLDDLKLNLRLALERAVELLEKDAMAGKP